MKKIFIFVVVCLISIFLILSFTKKEEKIDNTITLGEVTHSIFYAPLYVAIENGYFEKHNLNVDLILLSGADKVSAGVLSGDVQIGLAGAESAMYIYENNTDNYLEIFAGLTKRDGQFLISKNKDFNYTDLYGKEILVGRTTGMPALNFLNALKNEGIDKNKININYSIDFASLSGAFISGTGDFVNLFEPNALKLEQEGYGYVVKSIGLSSGEMPYTVFYSKKSFINKNKEVINNFRKAINEGLKFVKDNSSKEIAKVIQNQFNDTSYEDLVILVERYKNNDSWQDTYEIPKKNFQNLSELLVQYGLLKEDIDYEDIISK